MGQEIERKFLVRHNSWRARATGSIVMRQAYLARSDALVVRVRSLSDGTGALTIKTAAKELSRTEFEYAIPGLEAEQLLLLAETPALQKRRYIVPEGEHQWFVDVFAEPQEGLVLAEIELGSPEDQIAVPDWAGIEVTGDARYYGDTIARMALRLGATTEESECAGC